MYIDLYISINAVCICVLLIPLYSMLAAKDVRFAERIFIFIMILTMGALFLGIVWEMDILGDFDVSETVYKITATSCNTLYYTIPFLWVLYCHDMMGDRIRGVKRHLIWAFPSVLAICFSVCGYFVGDAISPVLGNEDVILMTGFILSVIPIVAVTMKVSIRIRLAESRGERTKFISMMFFLVPFVAVAVCFFFIDSISMGLGITFSTLVAQIVSRAEYISNDSTTLLSTRERMERFIAYKDSVSIPGQNLYYISIDLAAFKAIVDTYGHAVAGDALRNAAKILKNAVYLMDAYAFSLGSDQFAIVYYGTVAGRDEIIGLIREFTEKDNNLHDYALHFSIGSAVIEYGRDYHEAAEKADVERMEDKKRYYESIGYNRDKS